MPRPPALLVIPFLVLSASLAAASAEQTVSTFKLGAWGDDASRGNLGVEVQIETHAYNTPQNSFAYFWVGDDLADGAFIQFGYSLNPGNHCLTGSILGRVFTCEGPSESISASDARWQWQYWPDRSKSDFYFGIGPSASAGSNATNHEYTIRVSSSGTWTFTFDNATVKQSAFPGSPSIDPALIVAEGSSGNTSQQLGPARFDDLSYYDGSEWRTVDSLVFVSDCGASLACAANENGALAVDSDSLIVGSGIPRTPDGTLLWTSQDENVDIQVHPDVQFLVTSVFGTQQFTDDANLTLPKGMFAYVSLPDTSSSTPGMLGWLGAQDHFQSWNGSIVSTNLTIRFLVDSDARVTAVWTTDTTIPFIILLTISLVAIGALGIMFITRRRVKQVLR
ncbi:MAG TPA: hypothetical protein VEI80_05600 [Candidatus Acidoferrales bacterium]|nr:hypothetical protein [Candidatus Acidoferrales bacterium]